MKTEIWEETVQMKKSRIRRKFARKCLKYQKNCNKNNLSLLCRNTEILEEKTSKLCLPHSLHFYRKNALLPSLCLVIFHVFSSAYFVFNSYIHTEFFVLMLLIFVQSTFSEDRYFSIPKFVHLIICASNLFDNLFWRSAFLAGILESIGFLHRCQNTWGS